MGEDNPKTDNGDTGIAIETEEMSGGEHAHDACEAEDASAMAKASATSSEGGTVSSASSSSSVSGSGSASASASASTGGDGNMLSAEASADCGTEMHTGTGPAGFFGFVFSFFGGGGFPGGLFSDAGAPFEDTGAGDFEITISSSSDGDFFF